MPVTYSIAIDFDDDFSDSGEDISADVIEISWRLGMARPHDSVAAPIKATITVHNPDRDYSPEYTTDPLLPGKPIRIQSDDGSTVRTHFTGFIHQIEPLTGDQGARTAVIHAEGPERQLANSRVRLPPQVDVRADEVIKGVLDAVPLRREKLAGYWLLGATGHAEMGTNTRLALDTISQVLETGESTFSYIGDTWGDGIAADQAIRLMAEAERGRFFIDRRGRAVFFNRHHALLDTFSTGAFADDMEGLAYTYGADTISKIRVTITPRSIGSAGTVLWQLDSPQRILPGEANTRQMVVLFRDDNDRPVGALEVSIPESGTDYTANAQPDGSGADRTDKLDLTLLSADAASATLLLRNTSKKTIYLQPGTRLRGTPIYTDDPITMEAVDQASQALYGASTLAFDLPALTLLEEADDLSRFELARRKDPRGLIRSLQVSGQSHLTQMLARTIFDRITISETQTNHNADYFIVAEDHQVDLGGASHQATWLLEDALFHTFFIIGTAQLGQTTSLTY